MFPSAIVIDMITHYQIIENFFFKAQMSMQHNYGDSCCLLPIKKSGGKVIRLYYRPIAHSIMYEIWITNRLVTSRLDTWGKVLHWVTKKHIYLTPYECNKRIFVGLQFPINKTFWSKIVIPLVPHWITLHLVPFASKSGNCMSHNESLKMWEISCLASILLQNRQNSTFDWAFKDLVRLE